MGAKKRRLIMRTVILVVLGMALAYTFYAKLTKDENKVVQIDKEVPDFVLTDLNGETHRLSDYRGQGVLLNFWGTWCKPCEAEMPYINNQYNEYKDKGVQVLAVNIGETELAVKNFANKYGLEFPIVLDKKKEVMEYYGVGTLPATYLIDQDGKLVDIIVESLTEDKIKGLMEAIKP
ncbi:MULTISPECIES: thiol-disulfide oxidoreductase ResA [Bacillus]|uniref:thiol-disulfide oxidoreductase ResA n=1 Tax=Bacillus TaxID=1386 RepID=UPI00030AAB8F|nr:MULTISPECIES: thiol-disulfide oxidoreductase ResA [Bacillus]